MHPSISHLALIFSANVKFDFGVVRTVGAIVELGGTVIELLLRMLDLTSATLLEDLFWIEASCVGFVSCFISDLTINTESTFGISLVFTLTMSAIDLEFELIGETTIIGGASTTTTSGFFSKRIELIELTTNELEMMLELKIPDELCKELESKIDELKIGLEMIVCTALELD